MDAEDILDAIEKHKKDAINGILKEWKRISKIIKIHYPENQYIDPDDIGNENSIQFLLEIPYLHQDEDSPIDIVSFFGDEDGDFYLCRDFSTIHEFVVDIKEINELSVLAEIYRQLELINKDNVDFVSN